MLFLFRKDRIFRHATSVATVFACLAPSRSKGEGSSAEAVVLIDAGQPRRFEIARDELHFRDNTGAAWVQSVPTERSVEGLRARAASLKAATGLEAQMVM